jgi:ABC-type uncharacterized transport system substrate-binding protein
MAKAERQRPIIIAAVSDPKAILPDNGAQNLCGLSDAIDADYQIATIIDLLPHSKSISLLYSPHETNSSSVVQKLKDRIIAHGLRAELIGVYEPQQVTSASLLACQKSDVVLIPLDNQLAASMAAVIKASQHEKCAVILTHKEPIHHGAAIAFGIDYEKSGEQAAEIMALVLKEHKCSQEVGIINSEDIGVYVNERVVLERGIKLNSNAKTKIISFKDER